MVQFRVTLFISQCNLGFQPEWSQARCLCYHTAEFSEPGPIITLSTVGYGEVIDIAHNDAAKIFTMVLMVSGIGLLFYNFSLMTAFMVEGELSEIWRRRWMKRKISVLKDHYIICGIGETGLYKSYQMFLVIPDYGEPSVLQKNYENANRKRILFIQREPATFNYGNANRKRILFIQREPATFNYEL